MPLMQAVTDSYGGGDLRQMDITAPEGEVQIQIRADGKVVWVHVEGTTVLRVCRIEGVIKIDDARTSNSVVTEDSPRLYTKEEVDEMLETEYNAGYNAGERGERASD